MKESRPHNKVLPKAGLNGFDWTFVHGSTFVLRLNFSAKNPAFGNTQTVSGYVRTTVHHDTLWRTDNLTLLKTGTLKTDQSKHKFKIKKHWQTFIASIAEQSLPAYQV